MKHCSILLLSFLLMLFVYAEVYCDNYYVSTTGDDITGDGSQGNPWLTITHALSSINGTPSNPHIVFVEAGLYKPNTNGETFPLIMKSYISLQGDGSNTTILNAGTDNDQFRIITFDSVTTSKVDGFGITNGAAPRDSMYNSNIGGGIYILNSSYITISNNHIHNNEAVNIWGGSGAGGGIACGSSLFVLINKNYISENHASGDASGGAGIYSWGSEGIISDNQINNNSTSGLFGGGGAGIVCSHRVIIQNNLIKNNVCGGYGGGIDCGSGVLVIRNDILDNQAGFTVGGGGGISCSYSCTIGGSKNNGNNIYDNTTYLQYGNQLYQDYSNELIEARFNFFGTGVDPHSQQEVFGNFRIDPYMTSAVQFDSTDLVMIPSPVYFDSVLVNDTSLIKATFFNVINSLYDSIEVYGITHRDTVFEFPDTSFILSPIGRFRLDTYFTPTVAGDFTDTLTVSTNMGDFRVEISGVGYDTTTGMHFSDTILPRQFSLRQNFPNPFNPSTTIQYDLPYRTVVNISIYSLVGQKIKTLVNNEMQNPGKHRIQWNGKNERGKKVANGIYVYRMRAGNFERSRKMILLK